MKEKKNQYIFQILISIHILLRIIERSLFNKDCLDVASESDFVWIIFSFILAIMPSLVAFNEPLILWGCWLVSLLIMPQTE